MKLPGAGSQHCASIHDAHRAQSNGPTRISADLPANRSKVDSAKAFDVKVESATFDYPTLAGDQNHVQESNCVVLACSPEHPMSKLGESKTTGVPRS